MSRCSGIGAGFNSGSLMQVNIPLDSARTKFYYANLGITMNGGPSHLW
ncbi:MAG: hypothetical protein IPP69_17205 [Flavobacteriales bacterium]|nr:hypothetical protein [Flavobacteriales bacterium]